jgi:hypothetical protein
LIVLKNKKFFFLIKELAGIGSRGAGVLSLLLLLSSPELLGLFLALILNNFPVLPLVVLSELSVGNELVNQRSFPVLK